VILLAGGHKVWFDGITVTILAKRRIADDAWIGRLLPI
jgi:hypothetical protein